MKIVKNNLNKFENFLLTEYNNIARAHFKSIETITNFFRYYLLIMSLPISVVPIVYQLFKDKIQLTNCLTDYKIPLFIGVLGISLIGLGVFCYIVNLRLDVVLYARTVNGIRKYFYDKSEEDNNFKMRIRVLPQSPQLPLYFETVFFLPVVGVFAIMNGFYFFLSNYIINRNYPISWGVSSSLFFVLHFLIYSAYSQNRELTYLKSNILGIDIDGVLNKHREHFCKILEKNTQKKVKPEDITIMPVHEHPSLNITSEDERKVFNDPEYWTDMPVIENVADIIRTLKNHLNMKIFIFTHRDWPDVEDKNELIEKLKLFCRKSKGFTLSLLFLKIGMGIKFERLIKRVKNEPLKLITKQWLRKNEILYKKFIFEKGNDFSSDPSQGIKNRFSISKQKKIKFFVEDDLEKAIKLSYICDVVFLLSHPYNKPNKNLQENINKLRENLPPNIICVDNWDEIYKHIRRLS